MCNSKEKIYGFDTIESNLNLVLPGIADHDGNAGGQEHEDEEELLGWPAPPVRQDCAGPYDGVKTKVTP